MPSTTSLRAAALLALGLAGLPAHASLPAEPLYAFGADDYGLGNVFTRLGGSSSAVRTDSRWMLLFVCSSILRCSSS